MKPSDHPEFFRLAPPEGRSRESSIVLARDGRFFHEGQPVSHFGMQRAFAGWLSRHPDDGRYILDNGYDWTYLTVEGPSSFASAVKPSPQRTLKVELFDGRELELGVAALELTEEGELWLVLPDGQRAALTRTAQLGLAPWISEQVGVTGLEIAGQFWPIRRISPGP